MRTCLLLVLVAGLVGSAATHTVSHPNYVYTFRRNHRDATNLPQVPAGNNPELSVENDILGDPLNPDDLATGSEIAQHLVEPEGGVPDPILLAGRFQGDIVLKGQEVAQLTAHGTPKALGRNAIPNLESRWPKGVIPYVISAKFDDQERGIIARAMKNYEELTCIRFVPRDSQKDFIHILKGIGCSSSVGRVGGNQAVSLGLGCLYIGIVMHELMHVIGFWHEHTRPDRDGYITVNWSNIRSGMEHNFKSFASEEVQTLGAEYDLGSVMHYGPHAFAKDINEATITPKKPGIEIGQRKGLSLTDKRKVNRMYCKDTPVGASTSATTGDWCKDNDSSCKAWAVSGECKKNPSFMFVNCCWTCINHPTEVDGACVDAHHYCRSWAQTGECLNSAPYMDLYCKKSCELCHVAGAEPTGDNSIGWRR